MAEPIRSYKDLKVWQKSMDIVDQCYVLTRKFPKSELFGLCSQIQRAAVSVPTNIAEGHGREQIGDYLRHLSIAKGSLVELETLLRIARRQGYIQQSELEPLLRETDEVGRMLTALRKKLSTRR